MAARADDGYATAAAALICLALSVVAAASTVRGVAELKLARAELGREEAEYRLDGAHAAALVMLSTSTRPPPYRWTLASLGDAVQVLAEPERPKMSLAAAAADGALLRTLGAGDPDAARARLAAGGSPARLRWVADAAESSLWRSCAAAYVSPFGVAAAPQAPDYKEPLASQQTGLWRAGEVWRVVVTDPDGWRDERIVRFTGDGLDPVAILGRRLSRNLKGQQTCETLLAAASGA